MRVHSAMAISNQDAIVFRRQRCNESNASRYTQNSCSWTGAIPIAMVPVCLGRFG